MDFEKPTETGYTIYSKSGCPLCNDVKSFLKVRGLSFTIIDSDEYLFEDRDGFIAFIESITKKPTGGFPKVFADGVIVGGYAETKKYVSNRLVFDDNCEF